LVKNPALVTIKPFAWAGHSNITPHREACQVLLGGKDQGNGFLLLNPLYDKLGEER
jgi:hypothetical protein